MRAEVGFDFLQDVTFPLSGLRGDLTDVSAVDVRTGIGKIVEIQVQGMIQEFLSIKQQGASFVTLNLPLNNSTHDVGDFSLWTKILLLSEESHRPAVAFRFGFQMPNSNQTKGIGNNAANIYSEAILEKHFGKFTTFGDLGIAILTSPNAMYSQNDELMYGGAFRYSLNKRASLVGEVAGLYTPRKITPALLGTESRGRDVLAFKLWPADWYGTSRQLPGSRKMIRTLDLLLASAKTFNFSIARKSNNFFRLMMADLQRNLFPPKRHLIEWRVRVSFPGENHWRASPAVV